MDGPGLWIDRSFVGRSGDELFAIGRGQGNSFRVSPFRIDDERVAVAVEDRPAHLFVRKNAALDATRVEENRVAAVVASPERVAQRKKRVNDLVSVLVEKLHKPEAIPAGHWSREVDVEL